MTYTPRPGMVRVLSLCVCAPVSVRIRTLYTTLLLATKYDNLCSG